MHTFVQKLQKQEWYNYAPNPQLLKSSVDYSLVEKIELNELILTASMKTNQ